VPPSELEGPERRSVAAVQEPEPPTTGMLRDAIRAYERVYDDIARNWIAVESKAQGTVTIAGVFIAAGVALVKDDLTRLSDPSQKLLIAAIVLLLLSVIGAILVLFVRDAVDPLGGDFVESLANDAATSTGMPNKKVEIYLVNVCSEWKAIIGRLDRSYTFKLWALFGAQLSLTVAILLAGFVVLRQL
jgi:hypothetical protein